MNEISDRSERTRRHRPPKALNLAIVILVFAFLGFPLLVYSAVPEPWSRRMNVTLWSVIAMAAAVIIVCLWRRPR